MKKIRKWANFIKHPKGFLFTHHPKYIFDDDVNLNSYKSNSDTKVFEFTDIKKFYSKEDENLFKQLVKDVGNKRNVYVALPCPEVLIAEYNSISQLFCAKIGENPHFKEILKKHSTIEDYYTPSVF